MDNNYSKAYKEVIEILKYVPEENVNKIPKEMLEMFIKNMDNDYSFSIDFEKDFSEQNLLEETKAILANIYKDYWITNEQRKIIEENENKERLKIEEEKQRKYSSDNIFEKRRKVIDNKDNLPETIKVSFYEKMVKFFKKLFNLE